MSKGQLRIESMYAFIAVDPEDDTEGIISMATATGHMPLVGADMARAESLKPLAAEVAKQLGMEGRVKLVHFTNRTEVETL